MCIRDSLRVEASHNDSVKLSTLITGNYRLTLVKVGADRLEPTLDLTSRYSFRLTSTNYGRDTLNSEAKSYSYINSVFGPASV